MVVRNKALIQKMLMSHAVCAGILPKKTESEDERMTSIISLTQSTVGRRAGKALYVHEE